MRCRRRTWTVGLILAGAIVVLARAPQPAAAADPLDQAFEALKKYDWGDDRSLLAPIDAAVTASHQDAESRQKLERRLAALLDSPAPQAAKDYVCRKLSLIGSAASVPALARLLTDPKLSHMARFALERMPCSEAVQAMREALPKVSGRLKIGLINSLGVRRDEASTEALVALLDDEDAQVAGAAAAALGSIGNATAAKALLAYQAKTSDTLRLIAADACLACAERLLAAGKRVDAMSIYKTLSKPDQPKHVRLAATRGLLRLAGKK